MLAWGLLDYVPALAGAAILSLVLLLCYALALRLSLGLLCAAVGGLVFYGAFATPAGYFWLNRPRLERLVAQIQVTPAIHALEVGSGDEYRFLNGTLITHDRARANSEAAQPRYYVGDVLRRLRVPAATYQALHAALTRLKLGGYDRDRNGEIRLSEPSPGGTPWVNSFQYSPNGSAPQSLRVMSSRHLSAHWYYISEG